MAATATAVCPEAGTHDWRLSWPAVRQGWRAAGGSSPRDTGPGKEHAA
jgi:hypothetical protein